MLCLTANETVSIFDFAGNPFPQNVVSCCMEMNFLNDLSAVNMTVTSKFDVPLCSCCSCPHSDKCHRVVAVPWGPTAGGAGGHGAGSAPWALPWFFGGISQQVTAVLLEIGCGVSRGVGISSMGQAGIPQQPSWDGAGAQGHGPGSYCACFAHCRIPLRHEIVKSKRILSTTIHWLDWQLPPKSL